MKKMILLLALPFVMLCSCAGSSTAPETMPESVTLPLEINDNGREYSAVLTKDKDMWQYEFSAPESIKGMTVKCENGSYTVTLEKLPITESTEKLGKASPIVLITKALDMCQSGKGITAEKKGGKTVNKGVVEGADFTVTFEKSEPVSMEIGGEIAVSFKNEKSKKKS